MNLIQVQEKWNRMSQRTKKNEECSLRGHRIKVIETRSQRRVWMIGFDRPPSFSLDSRSIRASLYAITISDKNLSLDFHANRFSATADYTRQDDVLIPTRSKVHQSDPRVGGAWVPRGSPHSDFFIIRRICLHRSTCETTTGIHRQIKVLNSFGIDTLWILFRDTAVSLG